VRCDGNWNRKGCNLHEDLYFDHWTVLDWEEVKELSRWIGDHPCIRLENVDLKVCS
jgi:hypothetical protein